jgi:alcohol dehydrogenase (cytochrome c)
MHLTVQPKGGGTTISAGAETRVLQPFVQAFMSAEWIGTDPPGDKNHGRLTARDPISGKLAWEKRYDLIPHSTLMSTGSDLLFLGTADGYLEALDAKTGEQVWKYNVGSGVHGGVISYAIDGKQYIAVASGHGSYVGRAVQSLNKEKLGDMQESMAVVVFSLP